MIQVPKPEPEQNGKSLYLLIWILQQRIQLYKCITKRALVSIKDDANIFGHWNIFSGNRYEAPRYNLQPSQKYKLPEDMIFLNMQAA